MGHRFVSDAGDLREIILESATRPSFLNGWVTHGMLDVHGMVLVEPQQSTDLIVTCRPTHTGSFTGTGSFGTNSGLSAFEASEANATETGEQFSMAVSCEGSEAPHLELESFSGAVLLQADGLPFHFTPCVPAQWEANFLDPESPEANVTAALEDGTTVLRMMGTADITNPPTLPAFMVSRSQGLTLRDRVLTFEEHSFYSVVYQGAANSTAGGAAKILFGFHRGMRSPDVAPLPPAPLPSWTLSSSLTEDVFSGKDSVAPWIRRGQFVYFVYHAAWSMRQDVDDDASPLALAFPMPFYGEVVQDEWVWHR
eukprot:Skav231582  [mRNA]  locus=scaffold481:295784:299455:- [translate_table: standard]